MFINTDFIIIGAGPSGLAMAVQLIRSYGIRNFEIIEQASDVGGTWFANTYPGCGCDVPSHFYSFSFAPNPYWSRTYALQPEIHRYFTSVADQYQLRPHIQLHCSVMSAEYEPDSATWRVTMEDQQKGHLIQKRCRFLISAVGALSQPKDCDLPGAETYTGRIFHSARWDHDFDWKEKDVVCIGNGCSATQFIPILSRGSNKVKRLTQFCRQAHWLSERPNPAYSRAFQGLMRWIPGAQRLYRTYLCLLKERDFAGFHLERGRRIRQGWTAIATEYIQGNAPAKYQDFLVPKTVIGCKRRVMDTDYLASLHRQNVELVYDDPIDHIIKDGVVTKSGQSIHADAIILATGFETQKPLFPMEIRGLNGQTIADHWLEFADGSPEAYFGTCISGFPNFFMLMGPNTLSGHLSVLYTTECQINFILRILHPVLCGVARPKWFSPLNRDNPDSVSVSPMAERKDVAMVDRKSKDLVWATGCASWFIDARTGRNTIMYPDWQFKFWLRSVFVPWKDMVYRKSPKGCYVPVDVRRRDLVWNAAQSLAAVTWAWFIGYLIHSHLSPRSLSWFQG